MSVAITSGLDLYIQALIANSVSKTLTNLYPPHGRLVNSLLKTLTLATCILIVKLVITYLLDDDE